KGVAKWDGSNWSPLGSGVTEIVLALATAGNNLYAGGYFFDAGGATVNNIARWDGSNWSALGLGTESDVAALAVKGGDVYAGGYFTTVTNTDGVAVKVNHIAKWDGTTLVATRL